MFDFRDKLNCCHQVHFSTAEQLRGYERVLAEKRKAVQLKDMGMKCVVTDYALAHWYTQSLKLDVNNMRRNHISYEIKGAGNNDKVQETQKMVRQFLKKLVKREEIPELELNEHLKRGRNKGLMTHSGELHEVVA